MGILFLACNRSTPSIHSAYLVIVSRNFSTLPFHLLFNRQNLSWVLTDCYAKRDRSDFSQNRRVTAEVRSVFIRALKKIRFHHSLTWLPSSILSLRIRWCKEIFCVPEQHVIWWDYWQMSGWNCFGLWTTTLFSTWSFVSSRICTCYDLFLINDSSSVLPTSCVNRKEFWKVSLLGFVGVA